jgi:hypothetical protein
MNPATDGSRHIKPGRAIHGKDLSGTLLGYTFFKQLVIKTIRLIKEVLNL